MNAAFLILVICAATLTTHVVDAAPPGKQSAELARLILQALEMNKANVEQSEIISTKVSARVQEGENKAAKNPYKDFKPPADHKLPSKGEQPQQQGANGQFFPPPIITVTSFSGTLVTVEKVFTLEGKSVNTIILCTSSSTCTLTKKIPIAMWAFYNLYKYYRKSSNYSAALMLAPLGIG